MDESGEQERLHAARRVLLAGESPGARVAEGVERSWQRSRAGGLEPALRRREALLTGQELAALRERNERLVAFALPEIQTLHQQTAGTNSAVILADANGVILESRGDPDFRLRSQRVALRPGACWGESVRGTNAIGLALAEVRAATVHGPEHFLDCNTFLTCACAPIRAPSGEVLGLLDVSGDQPSRQLHALGLVRMGVMMVENRLLEAEYPEGVHVHFHSRPEFLGTLGQAIAVFDGDGRLHAANALAQRFLEPATPGRAFSELFQSALEDALRAAGAGTLRLRTAAGLEVCARLSRPRSPAAPAGAAPAPRSEARLHLGDAAVERAAGRARRVLAQGIPVVIEGESGTGKEWLARALHRGGARAGGPLVTVNCAAIPESLAEAELFGYAPGAFTGARREGAIGRIRQADGGTLFLDEIGDMPLELQSRLLRVLQERAVTPVGGSEAQPVDFDLVSATHRDLAALVAAGRFRADLYYRLCGLCVRLPALRERADLAALIDQLLGDEDPAAWLTEACRARLTAHHWPGNLRELHNVIRTAAALREPGAPVDLEALPEALGAGAPPPRTAAGGLRAREEAVMRATLAAHGGNVSAAARALGVSRSTLYRRLGQG